MRIVIIGAGPTGLGAAWRLTERGHTDFLLVDRNPYVGGLAASFRDDQGYTWDFAVHVAHSHYHYVDRLMEDLLPDGFYIHERRSWVRIQGRYVPYPFQNNIRHLSPQSLWDCVDGLLARENGAGHTRPGNFEEWVLGLFGQGIADHFLLPYNRKIWCIEPSQMGTQWTGDRVPMVELARILKNIILEQDDVNWGPNATFQFPKEGGTGAIWRALAKRLPPENVRLRCRVTGIDHAARTVSFDDGTQRTYDALISTMPLKELAGMLGEDSIREPVSRLRHTHVQVAGVAPACPLPDPLHGKTWLYCPDPACGFYRVTPFSLFSPAHVPDPTRQCSLLCEFSTPGSGPMLTGDLTREALDGLRAIGLLDADPATTHSHVMTAEYGYPVPTADRDDILHAVLPRLEEWGIYSRGRFGGWKYEVANMDHSLMQGVEAIDRLLDGSEECTIYQPNLVNAGKR